MRSFSFLNAHYPWALSPKVRLAAFFHHSFLALVLDLPIRVDASSTQRGRYAGFADLKVLASRVEALLHSTG